MQSTSVKFRFYNVRTIVTDSNHYIIHRVMNIFRVLEKTLY